MNRISHEENGDVARRLPMRPSPDRHRYARIRSVVANETFIPSSCPPDIWTASPPTREAAGGTGVLYFRGPPAKACCMSSAPNVNPPPHPRLWENRNPWIAGVLAYLIPGAGHFYQGRTAKGLIYCISILGLFFWGLKLGEGSVVYGDIKLVPVRITPLPYVAQLGVGGFALPAAVQHRRSVHPDNRIVHQLSGPFTSSFEGTLSPSEDKGHLVGTIQLEPFEGKFTTEVRGTFEGTLDGKATKLLLGGGRFEMDRPIKAGFRRKIECGVLEEGSASDRALRSIKGSIPRSFIDAYGSPPDPPQLQELNDKLGKLYELALVFTLIAGLLNILAVWDCVNGPAYGFGDEHGLDKAAETRPAVATASPATAASGAAQGSESAESAPVEGRPTQKSTV